jgi:acetolactate synthase-1/2/3 large subunit
VVLTIRDLVDDDTTVACDCGSNYIYMARHFRAYQPRHLLFSDGQQTLGVALPWAMAAAMVRPGSQVVSVSGDGGFLFSAEELETARRLGLSFTHVILRQHLQHGGISRNDEVWANVRRAARRLRHHPLRRRIRCDGDPRARH